MRHFIFGLIVIGGAVGVAGACSSDDSTANNSGLDGGANAGTNMDASANAGTNANNTGQTNAGSNADANTTNNTGMMDASGNGGGMDAAADGSAPAGECFQYGELCTDDMQCCSRSCNSATNTCDSIISVCREADEACTVKTDCCDLNCIDGACGDTPCISDNDACQTDDECCSGSCVDNSCAPLNDSCTTAGNACDNDGDCCSDYCKDGVCDRGSSFCTQSGDLCGRDTECCSAVCEIADGRTVGTCAEPPSGATYCSDGIEGTLCNACNGCCSRVCTEFGDTGKSVCQPASGCHVNGDLCREDSDCCGAAGTGLPGDGNVKCLKDPGAEIGICRNPMGCNPQGNVCHFKGLEDPDGGSYECNVSSARNNCCGDTGGQDGQCQLDALGVPRCNGLAECRKSGETCASAADCCNGLPCIPDGNGLLRCLNPPDGGDPCVMAGGACTIDADCCPGSTCIRPVGSVVGTCGEKPPDVLPDGAMPPACSEYGQLCNMGSDCCNEVPCTEGVCKFPIQ